MEGEDSNGQLHEIVYSYLQYSTFYHHLKSNYRYFLQLDNSQRKELMKTAELLPIKEPSQMQVTFRDAIIMIVIYGEVRCLEQKEKTTRWQYLKLEQGQQTFSFSKKTLLLFLNQKKLYETMDKFEEFYNKKATIEKSLPPNYFPFPKRKINDLLNSIQITQRGKLGSQFLTSQGLGLYFLIEGVFYVLGVDNCKVSQVGGELFGHQILWSDTYDFELQVQSHSCKYIYIPKQTILAYLSDDMIFKLKRIYSLKRNTRKELELCLIRDMNYQQARQNRPIRTHQNTPKQQTPKQSHSIELIHGYNQVLKGIYQQKIKPQWKIENQKEEQARIEKLKHKNKAYIYTPKKKQKTGFSTRNKIEFVQESSVKMRSKTETSRNHHFSAGYYSMNYDRPLSKSMIVFDKLRRYDQLKSASRLRKNWLSLTNDELSPKIMRTPTDDKVFTKISTAFTTKYDGTPNKDERTIRRSRIMTEHIFRKTSCATARDFRTTYK